MIRLVAGIVALDVLFLAAGFCVLSGPLRGRRPLEWISYLGVALLVGAGLTGVAVTIALIAGATAGPATLASCVAAVGLLGLALGRRWALEAPRWARRPATVIEDGVATAALFGTSVICLVALVGAFRTSPWLDDSWGIWLPKGVALAHHGLDARLFVPNGRYVAFEVPDYPLWWSSLSGLEMRFVGAIDVRAMNAQLALLAVAFVASAARLLWGLVRPWILCGGLLLLVASPEFLRHTQGGMADLPLAIYLSLCTVAAVAWLRFGRGFYLLLVFAFAATSLAIKTEGLPQLVVLLGCATLAAGRTRRRIVALAAVASAASATFAPWLVWRARHDVAARTSLGDAFDPGYLGGRTDRLVPSVEAVLRESTDPRQWLFLVPLAIALSVAAAVRSRRLVWLGPPLGIGALMLFWVWAYWTDRDDIDYLLATSAYRVVDTIVLLAAVLLPLVAENLARIRPGDSGLPWPPDAIKARDRTSRRS